MKKIILSLICGCIAIAAICVNAFADEDTAIIKTTVGSSYVDAYINTKNADNCTAQLGNTLCDIISVQPIGNIGSDTLILIDTSGSIPMSIREKTTELLTELIDRKQDNERFAIASFGTEAEYICDSTSDRYDLLKSLDKLSYDDKYTHIYSVIESETNNFAEDTFGRIIVISDGIENSKDGITFDEVLANLETNPCPIYTIGIENQNQESLKKFFSFSRKTNVESTLLSEEISVNELCDMLNAYREYMCVTVAISPEMSDGSIKYLQINSADFTCGTDIRTTAVIVQESISETKPEVTTATTESEAAVTVVADTNESKKGIDINTLIIIAAIAIIAVAITIVIILVLRKKEDTETISQEPEPEPAPAPEPTPAPKPMNYPPTEIIIPTSNDTIIDSNGQVVIRLTDINYPDRTFRTAVGQGVVVGRQYETCMVTIDYDGYVSRQHCRIFLISNELYIENISTKKETYLNDKVVQGAVKINHGDTIKIGHTSLKFEII